MPEYLSPATIREFGEWIEKVEILGKEKDRGFKYYDWFWNEKFQKICKKLLLPEDCAKLLYAGRLNEEDQILYLKNLLIHLNEEKSDIRLQDVSLYRKEKFNHIGTLLELITVFENDFPKNRDYVNIIKIFLSAKLSETLKDEDYEESKKSLLNFYGYSVWENWERK